MKWQVLKRSSIDEIIDWAQAQTWCQEMSNCMQDAKWHSEGDVWTHTKMVLEQLPQLESWQELDDNEKTVLTFTALFHDIAKPLTTEVDPSTGRVRSPKHAVKGEHLARSILRELECDLKTREQIAGLVRYHGRPAFLAERAEPTHEVVRMSWLVVNRLLYLFALADTRGRDTDSMSRPEENLHYWKLLAEEIECFEQPFSFASDHARFTFFHDPNPNLHYVPHEDFACTVTMMSGLPGSGKDTWILKNRDELPVVALDEIRRSLNIKPTENQGQVAQVAQEQCRQFLRSGHSFVFNATNTMRLTRARWLDLFADYNARIEIVYLEPPLEQLIQQNKQRNNAVPEPVVRKLADKIEPPTWLECHKLSFEH